MTGGRPPFCLIYLCLSDLSLPILESACRPDRLAQAIPQWQARGSGYIGVMRAGTDAHDMTNSPWYEPLGVLHNKKYYMYASGGMYALSSEAVQLLTQVPLSRRRLSGGGDDTSIGLWVMGYNIPYLDDRRLGVYHDQGPCPENFVGKNTLHFLCSLGYGCGSTLTRCCVTAHTRCVERISR